jgi:diadenosine tetraphosphate (Ap4A) HIT family hydrolase
MTCELAERRRAGKAPLWDCIYQTEYWDVAHAYNSALAGWLVLVIKRHITSLDELTAQEALELGDLIRRTSMALKAATGCVKTYVMQFAEQAEHPHVHFHIVARMSDQPADRKGPEIFGYLGVPESERVSEDALNELAVKIRRELLVEMN